MTEWEPATDAEVAMRNALRTDDQESYFRILAGVDLLLPVSADALAGLAPLGWGTWSTGGRTHVLAFTSPSALQACLADYTGSARRVAYAELADTWPNLEWWLAVNPGLPIEGYLPAWFVAQLSRGDLRLPTRGPGREGSNAPERIQDLHAAATMAANAAAQGYQAAAQGYPAAAQPGGPMTDRPMSGAPMSGAPMSGAPVSGVRSSGAPMSDGPASGSPAYGGSPYRGPASSSPAYGGAAYGPPPGGSAPGGPPPGGSAPGGSAPGGSAPGGSAPGGSAPGGSAPGGSAPAGPAYGPPPGGSAPGGSAPAGVGGAAPSEGAAPGGRPSGPPVPASAPDPADAAGGSVGPGGLPLRTPGGVLPSGLPSRVPGTPQGPGGGRGNGIPGGQFNGFGVPDRAGAAQPGDLAGEPGGPPSRPGGEAGAPGPAGGSGNVPAAYAPPPVPAGGAARPSMPSALDALASRTGSAGAAAAPSALDALGSRSGAATPATRGGTSGEPPLQRPDSPLPTRTPMAQTPPLPAHIPPPPAAEDAPPSPVTAGDEPARPQLDVDAPGNGAPAGASSGQATPPSARSASAQSASAQSASARSATAQSATAQARATQPPATAPRAGLAPPVIPGAAGADRSAGAGPVVPAALARPAVPPSADTPAAPRPEPDEDDFVPANEVERDLIQAVDDGSTDSFLSTLLLATVLVPVAPNSRPGSAPGESGFAFRTEETDGERFLVVFTSRDRLAEHFAEPARTVAVRFVDLIRNWPDPAWSFAVNPTSVIGARYPGPQVIALASWAVEAGLGGDPADAPAESAATSPPRPTEPSAPLTIMQKAVPAEQVDYYLERGYDRVAGFVHRAGEVEHLNSPGELFAALGLLYDGSPYQPDAKEAFVLRWPAHRPSLYRIPYGGQSEQALRAMDGWVIERPPFRGNGFAPGEGKDVIAEFKVDSVRLPHGAELWRMDADGDKQIVAIFDCDAPVWRRVGEQ
ncbi:SseB family protein [Actinoplanes sp. NPDC049118]|uniref:SseB family protein n=1 Tax=Actinoplanes sp. NPDC049118 TaxID=3155769 RepID=UPI0033C2D416